MRRLLTKLGIGVEELILIGIIILNILEFMHMLPEDLDYIKKVISWVALGYLLYTVGLSKIFYGERYKSIDIMLILAYFCLIIKDFFIFTKEAVAKPSLLVNVSSFFESIMYHQNYIMIEYYAFYAGAVILILLSFLHFFFNIELKSPSIHCVFNTEGLPQSMLDKFVRSLTSLFIFVSFFVIVFNLMMEWLGWIMDSYILVFGIFFYFFFFTKHARKFDAESFIYKVGTIGEGFYKKFIGLFHSKGTIILGLSGMLVLHLLSDIGAFIIPYVIGSHAKYFTALGLGHETIFNLITWDSMQLKALSQKLVVVLIYAFNIYAITYLLITPTYMWYKLYKKQTIDVKPFYIAMFFTSIFTLAFAPVFSIKQLIMKDAPIIGADIMTHGVDVSNITSLAMSLYIMLAGGILIFFLCYNTRLKHVFQFIAAIVVQAFLGYYIYQYFFGLVMHYISLITSKFMPYLFVFFFMLFLAITVIFYVGGYFGYVWKCWHDF